MDPYKPTCLNETRYLAKPTKTIPVLIIQIFIFSPTWIQLCGIIVKRIVSCMQECAKTYLLTTVISKRASKNLHLRVVGWLVWFCPAFLDRVF